MSDFDKPFVLMLTDEGTLDTVFECSRCHARVRFNYDGADTSLTYDEFVEWCREDATEDHACRVDERVIKLLEMAQGAANELEKLYLRRGIEHRAYFEFATRIDAVCRELQAYEEAQRYEF